MNKNILLLGAIAAVAILLAVNPALAAEGTGGSSGGTGEASDVFSIVIGKGLALFKEVRTIVFVLGGFGLVGLAVASIFGRPMWKWFAALALGLVVVAVAGAIVKYFTGETSLSNYNSGFEDPLKN